MNLYNLTEKFLLLFPFYRERVRVMDSYALRLSEAVETLREEKGKCRELRLEIERLNREPIPF